MQRKRRTKRSFTLIEVLISLSLVCTILMPCIRFYHGVHKSLEEDILHLQMSAVIDQCFFAIEDRMREQMLRGCFPTSGSGELPMVVYNSQGKSRHVPYVYSVDVRKGVRGEEHEIKACLSEVLVEIFPGKDNSTSVTRSLCVVL